MVQQNKGQSAAQQWVVQSDYVKPIDDSHKLETGFKVFLKTSDSQNDASVTVGTLSPVKDLSMSNHYQIEERISAADRKSTRLNSSHTDISRMPSSA
mgnify:CR=1 FL=1